MSGTLYLVGTPIGNLEDITLRALRVLREVDLVAAEDTRRTRKLLERHSVRVPVTSYGRHNAAAKAPLILDELIRGRDVALVADAGMPGVSDAGAELVGLARKSGLAVACVPGPSAAVAALTMSGIPAPAWCFLGFPPRRPGPRRRQLAQGLALGWPLVLFEAPHRVLGTLGDLAGLAPEARAVVARELTKVHEEVLEGTPEDLRRQLEARFPDRSPRGEYTLIVVPSRDLDQPGPSPAELVDQVRARLAAGDSTSQAVRAVARAASVPRQQVYRALQKAGAAEES
ncbi:MAG: 16S rRNA (cytidine(1402)-2'-O)-methyltransferase [bacterium]|nr:16S rRNA (cytidine(1402)-2'-O)-methyltransferase [bacterium]